MHSNEENGKEQASAPSWVVQWKSLIGIAMFLVTFPIASLIAEVATGRYRLVSFCLKAMWLLTIVGSAISICEGSLPVAKSTLYLIQLLVVVAPQSLIVGAFFSVAVPLGIDQIAGGSDTNISALLQWLLWAYYSGQAVPATLGSVFFNCSNFQASEISMIMSLLSVLLLSVGLILDFSFHHKLIKEPVTATPLSLIFKVLKYAAKHKYSVRRSAFTYCENEQPTRLDYGKSKYGGPFTTEQVEDVKTFWRVLVVILVFSLTHLPLLAVFQSASVMEKNFNTFKIQTVCLQAVSHDVILTTSCVMYSIPLYELFIYPCLHNKGISILQSLGIAAGASILSSFYGMLGETIRQFISQDTADCMFTQNVPTENLNFFIICIPFSLILGFTIIVLNKSNIMFICAQAPYNMNALLLGLLFMLQTMFFTFGDLLFEVWKNKWFAIDTLHNSKCGIWFYLTTLVLAVVSSALLGLVIRWYKARERDDIPRSQDLVEEVYHKYRKHVP